jgi:hypothetical protein
MPDTCRRADLPHVPLPLLLLALGALAPATARAQDSDLVFFHDFETITGDLIVAAVGPPAVKTSNVAADTSMPLPCSGQHLTTPPSVAYATVDTQTRLTASAAALTFSIRYNAHGDTSGSQRLLSTFDGTGSLPPGQLVFDALGDNRLRLIGAGGTTVQSDASIPADGAWHQVGFTFTGGTVRFYLDGAPFGSDKSFGVTAIPAQEYDWHLIEDATGVSVPTEYYSQGSYDDAALWTRALSDAEMAAGPSIDRDGDGLSDATECGLGTDPLDPDSDADALTDGDEVAVYATDPLAADTDGDGLLDGEEIGLQAFGCPDPRVADTDLDGLSDGFELGLGLDPCDDADADGDGLMDGQELLDYGTDPFDPDTDGDGLYDGTEVDMAQGGPCPDPLAFDSDGDSLPDGAEVEAGLGTDPCAADTDGDTVPDDLDDLPTVPGVSSGYLEDDLRSLCELVSSLPLEHFDAPNDNARKGRRNAICNKLGSAAKAVATEDHQAAWSSLEALLSKLDDQDHPADWMVHAASDDAKAVVRDEVEQLQFLISLVL